MGSVAGRIAKAKGARVVGVAGGPEKCRHVAALLGFDACVDYKAGDWREQLDAATPDGVDVGFENVGGPVMDHVLMRLNHGARITLCGVVDHADRFGEAIEYLAGLIAEGQLTYRETIVDGLENAIAAHNLLYRGTNIGKLLLKVAEPA